MVENNDNSGGIANKIVDNQQLRLSKNNIWRNYINEKKK